MKLQISAALAATLAAGLLTAAPLTFAGPGPGIYIGAGAGYNRFEGEEFPGSADDVDELDDERVSYKGIAGLRLGSIFAIEGQYIQFGEFEEGLRSFDSDGWSVSGILELPLGDNFAVFGKGGVLFWDADAEVGAVSASDDGNDGTYGVGVRLSLTQSLLLRIEYDRYTLDDNDIDTASANLLFHF